MKLFVVAGEASGDLLAALVLKPVIEQKQHRITGWGGRHLAAVGVDIIRDITSLSTMGFLPVLSGLGKWRSLIKAVKKDIIRIGIDRLVLVDFGGFNMRLAAWAKSKGIEVVYYIPPKVWASRSGRIRSLRKHTDRIIVIYPFEQTYFENQGIHTVYYGHPLVTTSTLTSIPESSIDVKTDTAESSIHKIALLPGSREHEIRQILPHMLGAMIGLKAQIIVSCAPTVRESLVEAICTPFKELQWSISGDSIRDILGQVDVAIVTSGTATLEAALLEVPQIVCYRLPWISYQVAKRLVTVDHISLVNLVLSQELVSELIQSDCTPEKIREELNSLRNPEIRKRIIDGYRRIKGILSRESTISSIAEAIVSEIK
ncbi:MAG: lipid-A-disaccharide synthase [Bacteroidota bacterium]